MRHQNTPRVFISVTERTKITIDYMTFEMFIGVIKAAPLKTFRHLEKHKQDND